MIKKPFNDPFQQDIPFLSMPENRQ
jgi:hypothetical protein